eukprot:scaffold16162_cov71-Cyclotella_meneghiniana.AAC.21
MRGNIETIEFCGRGNLIERVGPWHDRTSRWCVRVVSQISGKWRRVESAKKGVWYGTAQSHEVDPPILFCQLGLKVNLPMWPVTHLIPKVDLPKIETRVKKVDPPGSTSWDFTVFSEIGEVLKMMRISNESVV